MIVLETSNFHESLLGLLGKELEWVAANCVPQRIFNEQGIAKRLIWEEMARDEKTGETFTMLLMARVYTGKVWAVGIWTPKHMFVLRPGAQGETYFAAVPRGPEFKPNEVNWIVRNKDGLQEIGAAG